MALTGRPPAAARGHPASPRGLNASEIARQRADGLAGRDPTFYEDAQQIRFDRRPAHLSLGGGIHTCLGRHLARRELQVALEEFVGAVPEFRVKNGFRVPFFVGNILRIPDLQLQWK